MSRHSADRLLHPAEHWSASLWTGDPDLQFWFSVNVDYGRNQMI